MDMVEVLLRGFQLTVLAGVGNSRFIAEQAALVAPRSVLVVRVGTEKEFVASLHVDRLPVGEEVKERLRLLGLSRLEKVARLSRQAIISQFGSAGACISDIMQGVEDKRQIFKRYGAASVEKEMVGDAPFETIEQFAAALDSALTEVSAGLKKMGRVCRKVKSRSIFGGKEAGQEKC